MIVLWHGSIKERARLLDAFARYCTCERDGCGKITKVCSGHESLIKDQRMLDGLNWYRRLADRLIAEEFGSYIANG